jgi:hypothetical protein
MKVFGEKSSVHPDVVFKRDFGAREKANRDVLVIDGSKPTRELRQNSVETSVSATSAGLDATPIRL